MGDIIEAFVSNNYNLPLNTLNFSLNPGIVCTELVKVNLMACCLRSRTCHQCMSKKYFGLSFAYDAPRIWNDLPDDVPSAKSLFIQEKFENLFAGKY